MLPPEPDRKHGAHDVTCHAPNCPTANELLAEILQGNLDTVIVELLIVAAELVAAIGPTMKKLTDDPDRGMRLALEFGGAADVNGTVEIIIINVMIDLPDLQPVGRLAPDTEHLGPRANTCNVLVTPPLLVVEPQAGGCGAIGVELHALGAGDIVAQIGREWHFRAGNQIDDHADLFALGGMSLHEPGATRENEHKGLHCQ